MNRINQGIGDLILKDGRVYVGTTRYDGKTAFRPAIVNWRTRREDVKLIVDVIREISQRFT